MNRLGIIIIIALALTAAYYLFVALAKPSQPQVVVVRPADALDASKQNNQQRPPSPPLPPPAPEASGCVKMVYLKVGSVSVCTDMIHSMVKINDYVQVDFQGGMVQGAFMFASTPTCAITTLPQGVFIPCRAQILIPVKQ